MDVNAIVFNLKHLGIISGGDLKTINEKTDATWQNMFLFDHVKTKCDKTALVKFCDQVISVEGNPRMKAFGEDMKRMLAGKHLWACVYMYMCLHVCLCPCVCGVFVCVCVHMHASMHACVCSWHFHTILIQSSVDQRKQIL